MSKKINKINNLKKAEGFLQINYTKGHKYVDKAGEFVNALYDGDKVPLHSMNPDGMRVKLDEKKEIKVSPYNLWVHFVDPTSFDEQKRELLQKIKLVNSIFKPEKYTRIGWRNYLIYECGEKCPKIISENVLFGGTFSEVTFLKKIMKLDARVAISFVVNEETKNTAVLIDVDIYKITEISADDFSSIDGIVREIENAFQSDELLNLANSILA